MGSFKFVNEELIYQLHSVIDKLWKNINGGHVMNTDKERSFI